MEIDLTGLSDQQKQKVKTIVQLGQTIGGNEKIDNYLMQQLMDVYMPETNKMDELASLYEITEDEGVKQELLNEYYKSQGIDTGEREQQNALFEQFSQEFPLDSKNAAKNALYQQQAKENPELITEYYNTKPEEEFKWGAIPIGAGGGALAGSLFGPAGAITGGAIGGIGGLIKSILDSGESEREKEERLLRLIEQYKSNIPTE